MNELTRESQRIVTPEQLKQGYLRLQDGLITNHPYQIIEALKDGNFRVINPEWKGRNDTIAATN